MWREKKCVEGGGRWVQKVVVHCHRELDHAHYIWNAAAAHHRYESAGAPLPRSAAAGPTTRARAGSTLRDTVIISAGRSFEAHEQLRHPNWRHG